MLLSGPSRCYYLGQVDCYSKMANLAQIITPQICTRKKKKTTTKVLNPYFIVFFLTNIVLHCFVKANLAQIITPQKAKLGPDNNTTACFIYLFIYIYICCRLQKRGPIFRFIGSKTGPKFEVEMGNENSIKTISPLVMGFKFMSHEVRF